MTTLLGLELRDRAVLVVGGGPVAARRIEGMLADGARVRLVSPMVCPELDTLLAASPAVVWEQRTVLPDDVPGVWLVVTATGDLTVDREVSRWADEQRVWCVNASSAADGSARTPAAVRAEGLVLGVVSEGTADPRRSVRVRDQIRCLIDDGEVDLRNVRRLPGPGRVILVGGGPGDPALVTVAGRRALATADVVVADRLGPRALLDQLPADVEVIDVGKAKGHHPVPQEQINRILVARAAAGSVVVRLKGGDPLVLGRGGEEVQACRRAGIPVELIPGVSSAVAVPAAAGIPVTHRGVSGGVHVVTGHGGLTASELVALRTRSATVVVLMGVGNLTGIARDALDGGVAPETPVAIVENGTLPEQRVTRTTLRRVAEEDVAYGTPAVIVLGDVAAMDLRVLASEATPSLAARAG